MPREGGGAEALDARDATRATRSARRSVDGVASGAVARSVEAARNIAATAPARVAGRDDEARRVGPGEVSRALEIHFVGTADVALTVVSGSVRPTRPARGALGAPAGRHRALLPAPPRPPPAPPARDERRHLRLHAHGRVPLRARVPRRFRPPRGVGHARRGRERQPDRALARRHAARGAPVRPRRARERAHRRGRLRGGGRSRRIPAPGDAQAMVLRPMRGALPKGPPPRRPLRPVRGRGRRRRARRRPRRDAPRAVRGEAQGETRRRVRRAE